MKKEGRRNLNFVPKNNVVEVLNERDVEHSEGVSRHCG
jgi:hypothetical protein